VGFLDSFQNSFLKRNQRRHVKMDCIGLISKQLMEVLPSCEFQVRPLHSENTMGNIYILGRAKLKVFFDKF
jgi:hypothetical protein